MARLAFTHPVRNRKTSRRCLTGRVFLSTGGYAFFESSLERDWLIALDFDPTICLIREQPFSIHYELDGKIRRYTPDILVKSVSSRKKNTTTVYEVKPLEKLKAEWYRYKPRFRAAIHHCHTRDWNFKIVTEREIRTPFVRNAKFLRRYRTLPIQKLVARQLLYTLKALGETTPQTLLVAAYLTEEKQMVAVTELWRLIANRVIITLLDEPLTMQSPIWYQGG